MQTRTTRVFAAALYIVLHGCATEAPQATGGVAPDVLVRREKGAETLLTRDVERWVGLMAPTKNRESSDVLVFVRSVAEKLTRVDPALQGRPIGVLLISEIRGTWRSFALPGSRVYLSRPLLRRMEYENELASVIALELAHLARHSLATRLEEGRSELATQTENDLFGEGGVLTFTEREHADAVERAIGILYRAGYDPRGISALFSLLKKNPAQNPYGEGTIDKLEDVARRAVAMHSPLRNPVVRSPEFVKVLPRIQNL